VRRAGSGPGAGADGEPRDLLHGLPARRAAEFTMNRKVIPLAERFAVVAVVLVLSARGAGGQPPDLPPGEFALGIGYAQVSIGDSDSLLDSEDALRFDSALSVSPFPDVPQLRLGAALGFVLTLDNSQRAIVSDGGLIVVGSSDVPLFLFEPEVRLSWQQPFGEGGGFFVEPGIGAGGVYANLSIDADDSPSGTSFDESDWSFSARAFLNVGFLVEGGVAGVQASYMWADDLHLAANAGGDVSEFYVGIFGALRF
jgi:hypothetical protein